MAGSIALTLVLLLLAEGGAAAAPGQRSQPAASQPASSRADALRAAKDRLRQMLSGVQLRGSWQMAAIEPGGPRHAPASQPAVMSAPQSDAYSILDAHELEDDWWLIRARIRYEEVDVEVPIRLRVLFAGQTPVMTVENVGWPGAGPYSARVLLHDGFYAGTWSGPGCGGVLSGQIVRQPPEESEAAGG